MSKSRRDFIKNTILGVAGVQLLPWHSHAMEDLDHALLNTDLVRLTILHTNDLHSRIEGFDQNHSKYPGQGGLLSLSAKINEVRSKEENVLLFDAGDIFQGTPYFNVFGGELEFKLMSEMKFDASTLGNHDFDNGIEGFHKMLPHANFPFLSANYDFNGTLLEGKTKSHAIFEKAGLKIGVFGVGVDFEGLVSPKNYAGMKCLNPIESAQVQADILRNEKNCDLVVCLSHLGFKQKNTKVCDKDLAAKTSGIDLIIGGHTHTFLDQAQVFSNKSGERVLVNQAGWSGLLLGRVDFVFEKKSKQKLDSETALLSTKNYANF